MKVSNIHSTLSFRARPPQQEFYEDGRLKRSLTFRTDDTAQSDIWYGYGQDAQKQSYQLKTVKKIFYPGGKKVYSEEVFIGTTKIGATFYAPNGIRESDLLVDPETQTKMTTLYYTDTGNPKEFMETLYYKPLDAKPIEVKTVNIKYFNQPNRKKSEYRYSPETEIIEETSYWEKTGNKKRFIKRRKSIIAEIKKEHQVSKKRGTDFFTNMFRSMKLLAAAQIENGFEANPIDRSAFAEVFNDIHYDKNGKIKHDYAQDPNYRFETNEDEDWWNFANETKRTNLSSDEISKLNDNDFIEHIRHKLAAKDGFKCMIDDEIARLADILNIKEEEILQMPKNVFRKLAASYHSDTNNSKNARELYQIVVELYHATSDETGTTTKAAVRMLLPQADSVASQAKKAAKCL